MNTILAQLALSLAGSLVEMKKEGQQCHGAKKGGWRRRRGGRHLPAHLSWWLQAGDYIPRLLAA